MRFAEVAVDAAVAPDRTFSYSIPSSLEVRLGQVVRVPFGRQRLQGVVFSLPAAPQVPETRDILSTSVSVPPLTDVKLGLARWISSYYLCSLFDAAALMLPPGGRLRRSTYYSITDLPGPDGHALSPYQEKVLAFLNGRDRASEEQVTRKMGERAGQALRKLVDRGLVVRSHGWAGTRVSRKTRDFVRVADAALSSPDGLPALSGRAERQAALLDHLRASGPPVLLADARKEYGSAVAALLDKGWLERETVAVDRDPLAGDVFPPARPITLTTAQDEAAAAVRAALDDASVSPRTFLLEGVTGSGKTEVYLNAVERCLALSRKAIVMVPEIALTRQTIERFASRFPGQVAVLHSGLSAGERFDQWWKVWQGEYGVVIGSRSAVFAPQPDLGLIIVDEEHEWTYKEHNASPRYHAKAVASVLAGLTAAVVVLGSATPDVVSYHRAQRGELRLLRLAARVASPEDGGEPEEQPLANIEVVDMRQELREGNRGIFSRSLKSVLGRCLQSGDQAILFLNRRGTASYLQCRGCGSTVDCRRCDIAVTYHEDKARLICHHCGYRRVPPSNCQVCGYHRLGYRGIGTQSVVAEIGRLYPGARVLRWDRDSVSNPRAYEGLLEKFRSGEAQVLVGTQMIAKGLHFPAVTLVGVVSADVGINLPDYRAAERAFQLLCQVAGRAGRGPSGGSVVIQTFQPDNYAIRAAAAQDYRRYYDRELPHRREQKSPPFSKLIRLLYAHTNRAACEREALRVAEGLRRERDSWGYSDVDVLGPMPAYPARVRGHYRWQLHLRGPDPRKVLDGRPLPKGWSADVDPVGLA
jgi:primosomal protein N' (replication factor Y)